MATTERMGVDPLAALANAVTFATAYHLPNSASDYEAAHAAVAKLASAGKRVTAAFRAHGRTIAPDGGKTRAECEAAMLALDAALAPFSEAGR